MSKSIFEMTDEEFEDYLKRSSCLSYKQKKSRWYRLSHVGERSFDALLERTKRDRFAEESRINGDGENESPF